MTAKSIVTPVIATSCQVVSITLSCAQHTGIVRPNVSDRHILSRGYSPSATGQEPLLYSMPIYQENPQQIRTIPRLMILIMAVTATKRIRTEHLDLIPATPEILESDRNDRKKLAALLDAGVPESWPPSLLDDETLEAFIQMMAEGGDPLFAVWYWVLDDPAAGRRAVIGAMATATPPVLEETGDRILIGYSVLDEFQDRGYAAEAIRHLTAALFSRPGIRRVEAAIYPELTASIQVLEENGFIRAGEGFEEGTVAYVLKNPGSPA